MEKHHRTQVSRCALLTAFPNFVKVRDSAYVWPCSLWRLFPAQPGLPPTAPSGMILLSYETSTNTLYKNISSYPPNIYPQKGTQGPIPYNTYPTNQVRQLVVDGLVSFSNLYLRPALRIRLTRKALRIRLTRKAFTRLVALKPLLCRRRISVTRATRCEMQHPVLS